MRTLALAGALLAGSSAFALDPALDVSQYAHTSWRFRYGFTKGNISRIVQTSDGYLWLGTAFGFYRFGGVKAVRGSRRQISRYPRTTSANCLPHAPFTFCAIAMVACGARL
jgi:ligand-binding sensor domain-containing protein